MARPTLILVYNADQGLFNAITDTVHKLVSPATYECRLCQFTYGATQMRRPWRAFLEGLGLELAFYHRDEFWRAFDLRDLQPPVILLDDGRPEVLLSAGEIEAAGGLDGLIRAVQSKLREAGVDAE